MHSRCAAARSGFLRSIGGLRPIAGHGDSASCVRYANPTNILGIHKQVICEAQDQW
ncbi:hypothetical protein B0T16DRAFT_412572 [Cercophora newfieldiana]|uniref:Uncharacterized protein n=1 Tax=Cercophora newfieldiana TaxID=92897 RepID=A0AA39Y631_9PEZI|nr:hypothetical protein B0T16DRAFT_412572 [Cercophora newfieldiana]